MSGDSPSLLYVIPGLYPAGVGNHLLSLASGLVRRDWDVTVAYLKGEGELASEFTARGCDVVEIGILTDADPLGFLRLVSLMRSQDYDLVHTHLFRGDVYGSVGAAVSRSGPVMSTKHNNAPYLTRPPYKWLHALTVVLSDEIVTISDFLKTFYQEHTPASAEKFTTIHYGLDSSSFEEVEDSDVEAARDELAMDEEIIVGVVARLIKAKGIDVLLEAFSEVTEADSRVRLVVVGEGEEGDSLRRQSHELGIDDRVTFTGFRSDVPTLMHAFDLFVLPSRREGFGLVLLEAMAAATPVVATRTSAIPEVVDDGKTGMLVPPEDPTALSEAIENVLAGENHGQTMGVAGRRRLEEEFSVAGMVDETEKLYEEVADVRR